MLADRLQRPFASRWKEALKRLGITALTLPLVVLIGVILLFLADNGWVGVALGSRVCALIKGIQNALNLPYGVSVAGLIGGWEAGEI